MEDLFKQPTPESLFLIGLTIPELESLLPSYRPDVEKVIKGYIKYLKKQK